MTLKFYGIDPENPGGACPAVFRRTESGAFLFQGKEVLDEALLAEIAEQSPILPTETVVCLPARMVDIILKACREGEAVEGEAVR